MSASIKLNNPLENDYTVGRHVYIEKSQIFITLLKIEKITKSI